MIIRDYGNGFKVTDLTEELVSIPNEYGLINQLGITVTFEASDRVIGLIGDKVRGERNNVSKDGKRVMRSYAIPHFPLDDYITPQDVQGQRAYGEEGVERLASVQARKLTTIRKSHAATLETARAKMITSGDIYAPNGTVVGNFYTDFGVTRKQVAFDLSNAATDVIAKIEEVIAHIQDNSLSGDSYTGVVGLCSPEFFSALIAQAGVKEAYKFYTSTQEPQRNRLGGNTTLYREFVYAGCLFREIRDGVNGQRFLPVGECYFVPMGTQDTFISYVAPSAKLDMANTLGENQYLWVYGDPKGEKEEMELEFSHVHLLRRPATVIRAVKGATV